MSLLHYMKKTVPCFVIVATIGLAGIVSGCCTFKEDASLHKQVPPYSYPDPLFWTEIGREHFVNNHPDFRIYDGHYYQRLKECDGWLGPYCN